jgi:peptidoglycan/LPS O-acetylase OafA/YrhL
MGKLATKVGSSCRIPSLDGLRAVSIFMVVVGHVSGTIKASGYSSSMLLSFLGQGRLGVSMFFVISGFLITILLAHEQSTTHSIDLKGFYIRRAFRIFPGFYAYWLVALVLTLFGYIHVTRAELISAAIYVWNYVPHSVDTWFLGHTWSLSIEEQFYLIWPVILKWAGPKRGKWIALLIVISSPFIRVGSYYLFPSTRPRIGMMLQGRADSLMIGALLALVSLNQEEFNILKRVTRSYLIPIASLCFIGVDSLLTQKFKGAYSLSVGFSLQNLVIVLLIAHVVFYDKTALGRILNNPVIAHVGIISYSLYLWQQLFLTPKNTTLTGMFPLNLVFAFLTAELSYYCLEKPFLRWRKRFSNIRGDVRSAVPSIEEQKAELLITPVSA